MLLRVIINLITKDNINKYFKQNSSKSLLQNDVVKTFLFLLSYGIYQHENVFVLFFFVVSVKLLIFCLILFIIRFLTCKKISNS